MSFYHLAVFFFMSALATYPTIVGRRDNAAELLERILPAQGVLGLIGMLWGLAVGYLFLASSYQLGAISTMAIGVEIVLGTILSYKFIMKYFLKEESAYGRLEALSVVESPLGIVGMVLAALYLMDKI
jgi:uncharacterized protein YacL